VNRLWRLVARVLLIPASALLGSAVMFAALHFLPGDPVARESHQTPLQYEQGLHRLGLDLPLPVQYVRLLASILNGDLARTLQPEAVLSGEIGLVAALIAVGAGVAIGIYTARRANTWADRALIILIGSGFLFNLTGGAIYYNPGPCCQGAQILLPSLALGLPFVGYIARHTRTGILDVLRTDYITTARAKGLTEDRVLWIHALRNALIVVLSILGPVVTTLITGSLVIEQFTAVPGLGHELVGSILSRSYTNAVGVFVYYVLLVGVANLVVDLLYPVVDPRVRV
jgi:ABC-type dipeptide/oligopeptide/nickel transport system permease component